MTLVPSGSGSVDPHSHLRGASLAQSGMAGLIPCIPLSARESATGNPLGIEVPLQQDFDEEDVVEFDMNVEPCSSSSLAADPGGSSWSSAAGAAGRISNCG